MMRYGLVLLICLLPGIAQAHQLSTAYLQAELDDSGRVSVVLQTRFYDLERALDLDSDRDGRLRWREVLSKSAQIEHFLAERLILSRGNTPCNLLLSGELQTDEHYREGYLVTQWQAQCSLAGPLEIQYKAFFEFEPLHKLLVSVRTDAKTGESDDREALGHHRIIDKQQTSVVIAGNSGSLWLTVREFMKEGIIHIWIGWDHILFLLSLLLTCTLVRHAGRWEPEMSPRRIMSKTVWIVTAFTLAHSLTLTATALGWVQVPSRWVEVIIAASVALAALNNIYPVLTRLSVLTFLFGLVHGFGFAGVLGELGVPSDQKTLTVMAFNIGVELGQMVIVLVALPVLLWMRYQRWFRQWGVAVVSGGIVAVAGYWVLTRL